MNTYKKVVLYQIINLWKCTVRFNKLIIWELITKLNQPGLFRTTLMKQQFSPTETKGQNIGTKVVIFRLLGERVDHKYILLPLSILKLHLFALCFYIIL